MPARKNYRTETYSSLRSKSDTTTGDLLSSDNVISLSKLIGACLSNGASCYLRKNKDTSITVRIFDQDEKYEELLTARDDWDLACEEMIDALYGAQVVAQWRRAFVGKATPELPKLRKVVNPTPSTEELPNISQNGREVA